MGRREAARAPIAERARPRWWPSPTPITVGLSSPAGNDLLQFWEADSGTDVVLLYLESFGNPRRFGQVARRVTARKPVISVKSGHPQAVPRRDSSQTGALLASSDTHDDALFRHAGVISAGSRMSRYRLIRSWRVGMMWSNAAAAVV